MELLVEHHFEAYSINLCLLSSENVSTLFICDGYFYELLCCGESHFVYYFSSEYNIDYLFRSKDPRQLFITFVLHIRFLPFLTGEFSEVSLFEKVFNFTLNNSKTVVLWPWSLWNLHQNILLRLLGSALISFGHHTLSPISLSTATNLDILTFKL